MSFDWVEYLVLAKNLHESPQALGSEEASCRSATSRAYYAAFHLALEFAESDGYAPSHSGEDHRGVPSYFRNGESDKLRRRVSNCLDRMRDGRRKADYERDLNGISPPALAQQAIKYAGYVVIDLNCIIKKP